MVNWLSLTLNLLKNQNHASGLIIILFSVLHMLVCCMSYVDAIVHFCEQNNIDVESVPKLITKPLKEKLKGEARELNLLKRTSRAKLPL